MLRCVYVDLDGVLLGRGGSFLHDADGSFSLLGARALEACHRAGAEVVVHSARDRRAVDPVGELLGLRAWIVEAGDVLVLDGEEEPLGEGLGFAVARHMQIRACAPEDALAVGADRALARVVGTLWLAGAAADDPLLRLELEGHPRVRVAEERGGAAVYEAVVTTLAERR